MSLILSAFSYWMKLERHRSRGRQLEGIRGPPVVIGATGAVTPPSVTSARNSCAVSASPRAWAWRRSRRFDSLSTISLSPLKEELFNKVGMFWAKTQAYRSTCSSRSGSGCLFVPWLIRRKKMRGEGDQRGEVNETWHSTSRVWPRNSNHIQKQTADSPFWRVKHFWGTPSFASFKLGLFF